MEHITSTIDDLLDILLLQHAPPNILLGEDDDGMRSLVASVLRAHGYDLVEARSGIELIRCIHRLSASMVPLDLLITDIQMPGIDGLEVLEYLRYAGWKVPVVIMTAFGNTHVRSEAEKLDACLVLNKPFVVEDLLSTVSRIVPPRRPASPGAASDPPG